MEVVQQRHRLARVHKRAAVHHRLEMPGPRRGNETIAIHHLHDALSAVGMMINRGDLPGELPVMDRRGQHTVPTVPHALRVDRRAPTQLRTDGNFAEPLRLAGQQTGRTVLVSDDDLVVNLVSNELSTLCCV